MQRRLFLSGTLAVVMLLGGAVSASADPFAMHAEVRNFCCTDWTDKDASPPARNPGGGMFGFIGGAAVNPATVNRTVDQNLATAPFSVAFPASVIGTHFLVTGFQHPNELLDTLTLGADLENLAGVMAAQGGPGSFSFCPDMVGPGTGAAGCVAPVFGTGGPNSLAFHGRMAVREGPNRFGGAMGWLGNGFGTIQQHNAANTQFTQNNFLLLFSKAGDANTSQGLLARSSRMSLMDTIWDNSMMQGTPVVITEHTGFTGHPWTTGMVTASITQGNVPPFQQVILTGNDTRNTTGPDIGSGNLTLVSSNLYQNFISGTAFPRGNSITLNLPEPATGLSVAAGALVLTLVGFSRRRG